MQTSLARRQRQRRNGSARRPGGGRTVSRLAVAFPLFLFGALVLLGVVAFGGAVVAYGYYSQGLEDPHKLLQGLSFAQETVVYDRTGKVELARFGQIRRDVLTYKEIPPIVVDATTSIEDKTFWENAGFDPVGILSAAVDTARGNDRGASTITQQLVRARLLPQSVLDGPVYERKIREIIQSIRLTQAYPGTAGKQAIMESYLNQNFYGNRSYGIAAAAQSYFGVSDLSKLTLAEAAILAAIPKSPSSYDLVKNAQEECSVAVAAGADCPAGKTQLVVPADSAVVQRRNLVLEAMKTRSVLTRGTYPDSAFEAAKAEPVILVPQTTGNWLAPHFVWTVRHQLGQILCPETPDTCEQVDTGGYKVITTLDWRLQQIAEKWTKAAGIGPNQKNTPAYLKSVGIASYPTWIKNLKGRGIYNAALGAIDYRTGQVLAYVGSADYYGVAVGKKFQPQFDVLGDGWRQPGSAFKAVNYLTGIEDRTLTAASRFMDVVTDFGGKYTPGDADLRERGPVRLRQAIQLSLNIPAIKAAVISGPDHVFAFAKKLGIVWQKDHDTAGAAIAIGTLELHFIDLIGAYGAIADAGTLMPRTTILSVDDGSERPIWPPATGGPAGSRAISPGGAFIMSDILASNTDPAQNPFWSARAIYDGKVRRPAALKTGTTDNEIDLAAMGFLAPPADPSAPALAAGAWMGNSDNSKPPNGTVALETAASLWQAFLTEASHGTPIAKFRAAPAGVVQATVDANSGMLPGPFTTRTVKEWFLDGTVPNQVDDTKVAVAIDQASGLLWDDTCVGPKVTSGFLDLSSVDANYPTWQTFDNGWIARAKKGIGVRGGPLRTGTSYFGFGSYYPFGPTWGAPFAPTVSCTTVTPSPSPSPSDSGLPSPDASGLPPAAVP
jgi:membrane peptidoglycan carboxypeptidase